MALKMFSVSSDLALLMNANCTIAIFAPLRPATSQRHRDFDRYSLPYALHRNVAGNVGVGHPLIVRDRGFGGDRDHYAANGENVALKPNSRATAASAFNAGV